ncbi:MAG: hypothetical protein ACYDDZ_10920 [Acidimicrobiales bacterium]
MSFVLDPDKSSYLFACGYKGAGKTKWIEWYFRGYPYPRLVIDPNGDIDAEGAFTQWYDPVVTLAQPAMGGKPPIYECATPELDPEASSWPSLRYETDNANPHWRFVVDAIIGEPPSRRRAGSGFLGLGMPVCVWVDEIGEFDPAGQTPPRFAQVLHKGRHADLTLMMSGPRPKGVDPLCISQADLVAMFDTPHVLDRARLAETLSLPQDELASLLDNLDEHGYLAFEGPPERQLSVMPPLPIHELPKSDKRGEQARPSQ